MSTSPRYEKMLLVTMVIAFGIVTFSAISNNRRDVSTLEPVKVGFISALSGVGSSIGEENLKAVHLAIDEINGKGGVDGRPVDLIAEDVPFISTQVSTTTPGYEVFERRFRARFGRSPEIPSALRAYEAVYHIVVDLKK